MAKSKDKALGALLGVAVGDALGGPLEFMTAEEIIDAHGGPVREMIGGGWLNLAPGEITDDTEMTLCVAEGIAERPLNPIPAIGRRFIAWHDSNPKDIGNCCRAAIAAAKSDQAKDLEGWHRAAQRVHDETGGQTAGNGALMRTIYPALFYGASKAPGIAAGIGRMTHAHDHSSQAILTYTRAVCDIVNADAGAGPDWAREWVEACMRPVRKTAEGKTIRPDGYVINGAVLSMNAIRDTRSFEDALIYAVNLGGDADTIGAITGGLAGAVYGAETIPRRWVEALDPAIRRRIKKLATKAARSKKYY
jgi:ADP-ribosyl-[dinitrogen reductase] hydrolase